MIGFFLGRLWTRIWILEKVLWGLRRDCLINGSGDRAGSAFAW